MARLPKPRADLQGFPPYRAAPQIKADVRLAANEWAEPNRAGTWLSTDELNGILLNRYPGGSPELRAMLAERFRVTPDQLVLGNGSNDVLLQAFLVFGGHGRRTLLFQPTYSMHERLAVITGGTVVNERIGWPYEVTKGKALDAMARVKPEMVVFTTPNNPTGNVIDRDVIIAVAQAYPETLVLVDEAYSEFAGERQTLLPELANNPNMIISKTFSKVLASAGLRIGILVMDTQLADSFRAIQMPGNVSSLTAALAMKILKTADDGVISQRVALAKKERERVSAALRAIPGVEVHPSTTNFVQFRIKEGKPAEVHQRFLDQGVLIRDLSMWPANEMCLRVSIGTPAENDRFIAALAHALPAPAVRNVATTARPTLLIDASSLAYRAYHAMPPVHADDGTLVNAVVGFLNYLARLLADRRPARLAVGMEFGNDWRPEFRVALLPEYKSHRVATEDSEPDEVEPQLLIIAEVLRKMGFSVGSSAECEAEDVIATLAQQFDGPIEVVSGDRDLFTLVRDPRILVLYTLKGVSELAHVDQTWVKAKYGIPGDRYMDYAILRGDPSDGLPGVRGIGEKTASALLTRYGTLDGILAAKDISATIKAKLNAGKDYIAAARQVVAPVLDCAVNDVDGRLPPWKPSPEVVALSERYAIVGSVGRVIESLKALTADA